MMPTPNDHVLQVSIQVLHGQKRLADAAIARLTPEQLATAPGPDQNSARIVMKHLAGNMRSRWTDFLDTDGEKSWRQRDTEFEDAADEAIDVLQRWDDGWSLLFETLGALTGDDLHRETTIRGESHTVIEAILRQVAHYADHVGQIVQLARLHLGGDWESLSVPRGGSDAFNRARGHDA